MKEHEVVVLETRAACFCDGTIIARMENPGGITKYDARSWAIEIFDAHGLSCEMESVEQ